MLWNGHPYYGTLAIGIVEQFALCAPMLHLGIPIATVIKIGPQRFLEASDTALFTP